MRKIITTFSAVLALVVSTFSISTIAKSAEFFTIGTGGPTGVYFQTGNAICKMLHKSAIAKEHGRKKGIDKAYRCTAPSTGGSCLLYTSPSPRDLSTSRMPSSA